jgi:hypothetical protein
MRYFVDCVPTNERALEIEAKGGPGPVFGWIAERFKPEGMYISATNRRLFLIVDVNPTQMFELTLVMSRVLGQEPTVTPVHPAMEGGKIVSEAIAAADKAPKI